MFRKELKEKLDGIFRFKKSTFDAPSVNPQDGTFEQDTLFIQIDNAKSRVAESRFFSKVEGTLVVYAQMERIHFGFFNKQIENADPKLSKNLFFFDVDLNPANSPARYQNLCERRVRFIFLYSAQYDPNHGKLTELKIGEG